MLGSPSSISDVSSRSGSGRVVSRIPTVLGLTKVSEKGRIWSFSYSPIGNSSAFLSSSNEVPFACQEVSSKRGVTWLKDILWRRVWRLHSIVPVASLESKVGILVAIKKV